MAKEKTAKAVKPAKKAAKVKKPKDPNAPKKPLGAYMFFCADKRAEVKEENPGIPVTQIAKRLGELWKETDEEDRKEFQVKAAKDKERYAKELAAYKAKEKDEDEEEADEEEEEDDE